MRRKHNIISMIGTLMHNTGDAVLVFFPDGAGKTAEDNTVWLPKSIVECNYTDDTIDEIEVQMPESMAISKGLI